MKQRFQILEPLIAAATICVSLWMVFFYAPIEQQMGIVQKIFYFHVPAAYAMYLSWLVCTVSSILFITKNDDKYDELARSSAEVALLFAIMVMTTGPLWGRKAWGAYWVWDPRLTSALVMTLVVLSYVILRQLSTAEAIKKFSAALSVVGAALIPLIHISVYKWRGQHPAVLRQGGLDPEMKTTFLVCMTAFTVVFIVFLRKRLSLEKQRRRVDELMQKKYINQMNK
ncbi:MAG: cytochrome c biogenesis protein CcsA [Deltaproteobacteria bacterium]|nr:cytochrome c biogenesis protein CcsA [Deltaproteobacteria bacterium]